MELLPGELLNEVCNYLSETAKAMLSITCKKLYRDTSRTYSVLNSCIVDGNYKFLRLVESWGAEWFDSSYKCLGKSTNIALLNMCILKLQEEQVFELVAISAACESNVKVLTFLNKCACTIHMGGIYSDKIVNKIIDILIKMNNFDVLCIYTQGACSWIAIAKIALRTNNKALFQYCYEHNSDCRNINIYVDYEALFIERFKSWNIR